MADSPMYCSVCGTPVWWSEPANAWFHEAFPRYLATRALKVSKRVGRTIDLSLPADLAVSGKPARPTRNLGTL